ncbi:MAG: ATPase [Oscillospiraceae bacterium]|nr:ATPase [Oscillospiraceae bacterium]
MSEDTNNRPLRAQSAEDIFALDIGTRNVVGMLCHSEGEAFRITDCVSMPHRHRSMSDGQIEDISRTAETISAVRNALSAKTGIDLKRASIAAAGRALVTRRTSAERLCDISEPVTDTDVRELELEAVSAATEELGAQESDVSFYCVGHSVVGYALDGYPIQNLAGHRGNHISADVLAAFLPSTVVNGLYSAMEMCGLVPESLTLEPIAAMNVIIPPELRLINIALADIGAGTADIAISRNGSIVAYAMCTTAGDEITEEIVRQFLVDFDTAEAMKTSTDDEIAYTDILGFDHTSTRDELFERVSPAVKGLAESIASEIEKANGGAPAAVFIVGGGSLVPHLDTLIADCLGMPHNRVAVGGRNIKRRIEIEGNTGALDPLLITPVGIGITAGGRAGYDFSSVTLNGRRIRIFDTKALTCAELLMQAGYRANEIIARTGRGIIFTVNGERRIVRGTSGTPAQIAVNGHPVTMEYTVKQGDEILFTPAVEGTSAKVTAGSLTETEHFTAYVNGRAYPFGTIISVNGTQVSDGYCIQNFDEVTIMTVNTAGELASLCDDIPPEGEREYIINGREADGGYYLSDGDRLSIRKAAEPKPAVHIPPPTPPTPALSEVQDSTQAEEVQTEEDTSGEITVILNSAPITLPPDPKGHIFLDLMAVADIDMTDPPRNAIMILTLNGKDASFTDPLFDGDTAVIRWDR